MKVYFSLRALTEWEKNVVKNPTLNAHQMSGLSWSGVGLGGWGLNGVNFFGLQI